MQCVFSTHLRDDFFSIYFYFPLVIGYHGICHIAIIFVFFNAPDVCTYFCPFFFPLLEFPLLFQIFVVISEILLLFHVCKCFFFYVFVL